MNTSASDASCFAYFSSFSHSPGWNWTFSSSMISPSFISFTALSAFGPTVSFSFLTFTPKSCDSDFPTPSRRSSSVTFPFGLPRWLRRMMRHLCSRRYFMVGSVAFILPSSSSTLKSALTRTRFPVKSASLRVLNIFHPIHGFHNLQQQFFPECRCHYLQSYRYFVNFSCGHCACAYSCKVGWYCECVVCIHYFWFCYSPSEFVRGHWCCW